MKPGPLSLSDWCRQSIAKSMFDRVIDEDDMTTSHELLYEFISSKLLPQSTLLSVLRAFILALDKGHACLSGRQVDCSGTTCRTRMWGETKHSKACQYYEIEDKGPQRRFRSMALSRHCTHVVMATWKEKSFSPSCLVEESFPIGLSLRMRQWLVMYAVDGFLMCNNICQAPFPTSRCLGHANYVNNNYSDRANCCDACTVNMHAEDDVLLQFVKEIRDKSKTSYICGPNSHPMKTLDLRVRDGNVHCTRAALTALKLALEKIPEDAIVHCLSARKKGCGLTLPTIKLEVAVIGSTHDWFSDVLLTVLRKSALNGFRVDLSSLRFEDVSPITLDQIIRSLSDPTQLKQFHFRHLDAKSLLEARDCLRHITGVEEFSLATCDFQPVNFTIDETLSLWNEVFVHWPNLRSVEFDGIRLCFDQPSKCKLADNETSSREVKIPPSLHSLEFADESITISLMEWLSVYFQKQTNKSVNGESSLRSLRLVRETGLARHQNLWNKFLSLTKLALPVVHSLCIDHCSLGNSHANDVADVLRSGVASTLRRLSVRESYINWQATCRIFDSALSSSLSGSSPKNFQSNNYKPSPLIYFSSLVPRASDETVPTELRGCTSDSTWTYQGNPRCHFEDALRHQAGKSGRGRTEVELFWEPECDWT